MVSELLGEVKALSAGTATLRLELAESSLRTEDRTQAWLTQELSAGRSEMADGLTSLYESFSRELAAVRKEMAEGLKSIDESYARELAAIAQGDD